DGEKRDDSGYVLWRSQSLKGIGFRETAWKSAGVEMGTNNREGNADRDAAGRSGRRRPRVSMDACRSRANADDRLTLASLGPVEGGDGIVEGRDVADVCPQPTIPDPLNDLTQMGRDRVRRRSQ